MTEFYYYHVNNASQQQTRQQKCLAYPGTVYFENGISWMNMDDADKYVCRSAFKISDSNFKYLTYAPAIAPAN